MYTQVASKLILDASAGDIVEYSQAVSLEGANALFADCQVLSGSGGTTGLTITAQIGNDLENWFDISGTGGGPSPTSSTNTSPAILTIQANQIDLTAASYCRLKYSVDSGGVYAVAAGISVANL